MQFFVSWKETIQCQFIVVPSKVCGAREYFIRCRSLFINYKALYEPITRYTIITLRRLQSYDFKRVRYLFGGEEGRESKNGFVISGHSDHSA